MPKPTTPAEARATVQHLIYQGDGVYVDQRDGAEILKSELKELTEPRWVRVSPGA